MSLISDALKKARQEAARQDSLRPGLPYAVGAATAPAPRAPWISLLAGLGAGCLLAAAIFAIAFFGGWGPFHKPAAQTQVAAAPAPAAPAPQPVTAPPSQPAVQEAPPPKPVAVVETPAPKPAPEPPKREPEAVRPAPPQTPPAVAITPRPAPETAPAPQPAAEAPAPAPAPVQAAPAPVTPPQSAPEGGLVEGNTYTGELPVPGGGSVKLNGIVYSPDHPIAVLDGRVMGPGENVQGFTVVAIESGRVKLQGHGATVYLSPK
jgi:outer membrane biosynthesis protein TonB